MNNVPPIAYVIGGVVVLLTMARYFPKLAGWVLLSLVLLLLLLASERGIIGRANR